jgi:hypothetical protein
MADKKVKGAGDRFLPGSNIAKHREWRGLKDTWYDYVEWVKVLGIMGGFVAKSPVRIARGMLTYRWMGSYLAALNMIDRCVEGLRGPALRVARLYLNTIMKGSTTSIAEMMMGDRRFGDNAFGRTQAPDSLYGASLFILSKYRILRSGIVLTPNTSVWADLLIGDDTVRVFNNHLRSTAIKAADNEYITNRDFISDTAREVKIRSIVSRLRENSILRAAQVDSIADVIADARARCIVCGDFNDTPMSYVYRTMAGGLNDAFSKSGSGYSHTFRGFFNTLRIDYVLCSDSFDPVSYEVPQVEYSDHLPVVVRLQKNLLNN